MCVSANLRGGDLIFAFNLAGVNALAPGPKLNLMEFQRGGRFELSHTKTRSHKIIVFAPWCEIIYRSLVALNFKSGCFSCWYPTSHDERAINTGWPSRSFAILPPLKDAN